MNQLEKALAYASSGIKVFPCGKNKAPLVKGSNGFKSASKNVDKINEWWSKFPDAMIGAPNDQFTVIDVDDADLCETGKLLTNSALHRLYETGVVVPQCMKVKTISGGKHIYFKRNDVVKRAIKCLPNIDLLGIGGYVVLPDQTNYVADVPEPWKTVTRLPTFDHSTFSWLCNEFDEITKTAVMLSNMGKKTKKRHTSINKKQMQTDIEGYKKAIKQMEQQTKMVGTIDYENNKIKIVEQSTLYLATTRQFKKADHNDCLLNSEGMIDVEEGSLSSEVICRLFYNRQIQKKCANFLGLKVSETGTTLNRSILPDHKDAKPSMGVRWHSDKSHLIIRDFANFYGSKYEQCDYNIVRLYAAKFYKANVQRLSAAEFVVWFTRLLVDAGIINIEKVKRKFHKDINELKGIRKTAAEKFQLLDACKRLYSGYCGSTTFADKFSSAWCGIGVTSIGRVKSTLVEERYLDYDGIYDCSGGKRTDNFMATPLYKMVDRPTGQIKVKGMIMDRAVRELKEQRRQEMGYGEPVKTASQNEKEVQEKYPNLGTVYKLSVSQESYDVLANFCEDFDIPNLVRRKNMICPIMISEQFIEDVYDDKDTIYPIKNLQLSLDETEDGTALILQGEGEGYENIWSDINKKHWKAKADYLEDPVPYVILSYDIGDKELDLDKLEVKLAEYLGSVMYLGDLKTMYLDDEQIDALVNGTEVDS